MTRARISPITRWLGVVAVLAMASGVVTSWRPAPGVPRAVVTVAKLLPPLFTTLSAQTQISGCSANAVSGNKFVITLTEVKALAGSVETLISNTPSTVNVVGQDGDVMAQKFLEGASLPAGSYTGLKITLGSTVTLKGQVTCTSGLWGGGSRTYYTDPTVASTASDPFVPVAANATPQDVQHTVSTSPVTLPVNFTVVGGVATVVNIGFQNPQIVLYDASSITADPLDQIIKIFAGNPDASSASVQP